MAKERADSSAYRQLKKDLSAGHVGGLYLFWGEEAYLRDHALGRMKELLLPPGMEAFNLHALQGKKLEVKELEQAVDCLPVMSERTLVQVTDYDLFKAPAQEREALEKLLADLPDYCCLIFVYHTLDYKPDGRTKLAAALKKRALTVGFHRQQHSDLTDWIRRRFLALERDIDPELARYLIFLCGDLMHSLIPEIGKIAAYAKDRQVTRGDIDAVATPQLDAVVFQMTDAIARGEFDKAAAVLGDLLSLQEHPIRLLSVLGRQLRQIYTARLALERGKGPAYLASLWKMRSSYPAEKLLDAARRFSLPWCRRAVIRCAQTDLAMKSTGADGRELLTGLLLELADG